MMFVRKRRVSRRDIEPDHRAPSSGTARAVHHPFETFCLLVVFTLTGSISSVAPEAVAKERAEDGRAIELVSSTPYSGPLEGGYRGTDLAFAGKRIFGGQTGPGGGVHVFERRDRGVERVARLKCPGNQNDVEAISPGLLAMGFHDSKCSRAQAGIQLLRIQRGHMTLAGAVKIDGGAHTLTRVPQTSYIYSSPGGPDVGAVETIIDIADPEQPKVTATFEPGGGLGCHDVSFSIRDDRKLAFCPAGRATQVWDVSNPTAPVVVSTIANPAIAFHHSAIASPDGDLLVIGDEGNNFCSPGGAPAGGLFFYDISNPQVPLPVGSFSLRREAPEPFVCTAHYYNFVPGSRTLVTAWSRGGLNVLDLKDPARPVEIAYYRTEETDYWSAYWYRGLIYASGVGGLDVFKLESTDT